jgi:hypothetical protein
VEVTSLDVLTGLLSRGVNRQDTDGSPIAELGWSLSLWNGDQGGISASTRLHCGCTSKRVGNSATVAVSADGPEPISNVAAIDLLKALVELWDADKGVVTQSTEGEDVEVAAYKRRSWPMLLPKRAVRHADGIITTSA